VSGASVLAAVFSIGFVSLIVSVADELIVFWCEVAQMNSAV
jgi:hypothetical protein